MIRYKQFFGVDPSTAAPLFTDLRNKFSSFKYKDGLMTMNWLFLNNKQSILSGRWGCCKEYCTFDLNCTPSPRKSGILLGSQ
jgi:hypothetical protein